MIIIRIILSLSHRRLEKQRDSQTIWRCRICGYEYVGEELPDDFICPLCKHPASDFEKVVKKTEVKEMAANKYAGTQTEKNLTGRHLQGNHRQEISIPILLL